MFAINGHLEDWKVPVDGFGALAWARVASSELTHKRGARIFGQGRPAEYIYQVVEGAVRSCKLLSDGRRQIGAFHLTGDVFGLENGDTHRFTAEAIIDSTVRTLKRRCIDVVAEDDPHVSHQLLVLTTQSLQRAEDHMLLLGRKSAVEKVAAFLLEMDCRLAARGIVALPMTRRDIADYLGLTIETVSRTLSMLRDRDILRFDGETQRDILLLDRLRLAELGC
jgi:CRP/FNR family nitrogen fixation transcriptional regulator